MAGWIYPAPFDIYNVNIMEPDLFLRRSTTGEVYCPALDAVVGSEARVRGRELCHGVLDVGLEYARTS